jgi:hypothetical protein
MVCGAHRKQKRKEENVKKITQIVTHEFPHLDELLALFLVREYGRHRFDVTGAKLATFTTGQWPKGQSASQHPEDLFIGCGESPFDEHGKQGYTCSARLMADYLAVGRERCFEQLLGAVQDEDRHGARGVKNHIAMVVKGMTFHSNVESEVVYEWLKPLFTSIVCFENESWEKITKDVEALKLTDKKAEWGEKKSRFAKLERPWLPLSLENCSKVIAQMIDEKFAKKEWLAKGLGVIDAKQRHFEEALEVVSAGKTVEFESYRGHVKMLVVESDNTQIGPASRKMGFDMFIQRNSSGNVIIMTDTRRNIWLNNVAALIRAEEAKSHGVDVSKLKLSAEGTLKAVPNWHLHEGVPGQLYNGTLTASAVEPTAIGLDRLVELVKVGLQPRKISKPQKGRENMVAVKEAMPAGT